MQTDMVARTRHAVDLALLTAVSEGDLAGAQAAVSAGANVEVRDDYGQMPLHLAATCSCNSPRGHQPTVEWLIVEGAPVDACDCSGQQPLHLAAYEGNLGIARLLQQAGAAADGCGMYKQQPLHHACMEGHLAVVVWLHSIGADIDACDAYGQQPLHHACLEGHLAVARWLHSVGAAIDARDSKSRTPIALARANGHEEIVSWLERATLESEHTREERANAAAGNLMAAVERGDLADAQAAVTAGVNGSGGGVALTSFVNSHHNPLHTACAKGQLDIVRWLHSVGASVHAVDDEGMLPLHHACLGERSLVACLHACTRLMPLHACTRLTAIFAVPTRPKTATMCEDG